MAVTGTKVEYLTFLRGLVSGLLKTFGETRKRPGRTLTVRGTAGDSLRNDGLNHLIVSTDQRLVCKPCNNRFVFLIVYLSLFSDKLVYLCVCV